MLKIGQDLKKLP